MLLTLPVVNSVPELSSVTAGLSGLARLDAARECLVSMSTDLCKFDHHLVWKYGGKANKNCPVAEQISLVYCGHDVVDVHIRDAVEAVAAEGLIMPLQKEALLGVLNLGLKFRADQSVAVLCSITYQKVRGQLLNEEAAVDALAQEGFYMPLDSLTCDGVEKLAEQRQLEYGAPTERIRQLVIDVLDFGLQFWGNLEEVVDELSQHVNNAVAEIDALVAELPLARECEAALA